LGERMTAAPADGRPLVAHAGTAGALLPVHLLLAALDHSARTRLHRADAFVRLVHDDDVVQQLLVDRGRKLVGVELVAADLGAGSIFDGDGNLVCHKSLPPQRGPNAKGESLLLGGLLKTILVRVAHDHVAAVRPGHRPANEQRVVLGIHLDDLQIPNGATHIAVLAGHLQPGKHARRISRRPDRPHPAVNLFRTMGSALAAEVVPLHRAGVTTTLRRPDHVDKLDALKVSDGQGLPNLQAVLFARRPKLAKQTLRLGVSPLAWLDTRGLPGPLPLAADLRNMTALGPRREAARLVVKSELNGL